MVRNFVISEDIFNFMMSPSSISLRSVRREEETGARGVLVTPDWPGSVFLMRVEEKVREGTMVLRRRFSPRMICPREILSDTFRGRLKFL